MRAMAVDKAERRAELLLAARDEFAERGFHDAKVDDIAARAGVAKGTFYLYFRDKRSVFEELVDGLFARLGGAILTVDVATDIESQVKHSIRAVVSVLRGDPTTTRLLLAQASGLDPAFAEKVRSFFQQVHTLLREALADGQRMGIVASGDPSLFASFTLGGLKELLQEPGSHGSDAAHGREQLVDELFRLLSSGYLRIGRRAATVEGGAKAPRARRRMARTR
jgi:AcrR family transcriptional regulator